MMNVRVALGDFLYSVQSSTKYLFSLPLFHIEKDKIVFINFNGKGYGDNPKYIAEEIIKQKLPYKLIWLTKDNSEVFPAEIHSVKFRTIKAIYELATAGCIITNVKNDLRLNKRKGQYVIQTWHASLSPKMLEQEAIHQLSKKYINESRKNSEQTDLFISNSHLMTQQIYQSFWYQGEVYECGLPRNDVLIKDSELTRKEVRRKLNINDSTFVVLYTPTFRDNGAITAYSLDYRGVIESFQDRGNSDVQIWVRLHPNISKVKNASILDSTIVDFTNYPDIQELIVASDVLITDYSSTMFDYALMGKPVFLFAQDIRDYDKMRGLKKFYFQLPFPICSTNEQLTNSIRKFDTDDYLLKLESFMKEYGNKDSGEAAEKIVQRIKEINRL